MGEVYRARERGSAARSRSRCCRRRLAGPGRCSASSRRRGRRAPSTTRTSSAVYDVGTHDGRALRRHGAAGGRDAARSGSAPAPSRRARRSTTRSRSPGPGRRAREGHRPPRPEAGEHVRDAGRPRQDPRLRPGQADELDGAESGQTDAATVAAAPSPARCSGRSGYMSPEQVRGSPPTSARTSSPSARSSTRCSPASARSAATRRSRP